jgi:hypothetical protein
MSDKDKATQYDYDFAPAWMPKAGDVLEGTVASIDSGNSAYGVYPIVTVEQEDGEKRAVHCFHTTIRGQLGRIQPKVGDPIGIKYLGKKQSSTNKDRKYDAYRVVSDQGGYDWSREVDQPDIDPDEAPY